jgi:2-polyprenyl-3-methyl-5-hydroxy-6-metoxy-1,4-benzoquinol methylase
VHFSGSPGLLTPFLSRSRVRAALPHVRGSVLDHGCGPGALAARVAPAHYLGVDLDEGALEVARTNYPSHQFRSEVPAGALFDTVVSLAVIEHVDDPAAYMKDLSTLVREDGRVVVSTPHPRTRTVYHLGAKVGLFSTGASEDHKDLLGEVDLAKCARLAALRIEHFGTFMAGANQIVVLRPA